MISDKKERYNIYDKERSSWRSTQKLLALRDERRRRSTEKVVTETEFFKRIIPHTATIDRSKLIKGTADVAEVTIEEVEKALGVYYSYLADWLTFPHSRHRIYIPSLGRITLSYRNLRRMSIQLLRQIRIERNVYNDGNSDGQDIEALLGYYYETRRRYKLACSGKFSPNTKTGRSRAKIGKSDLKRLLWHINKDKSYIPYEFAVGINTLKNGKRIMKDENLKTIRVVTPSITSTIKEINKKITEKERTRRKK